MIYRMETSAPPRAGTVWMTKQARLTTVQLHARESILTSSGKARLWGRVGMAERKRAKRHLKSWRRSTRNSKGTIQGISDLKQLVMTNCTVRISFSVYYFTLLYVGTCMRPLTFLSHPCSRRSGARSNTWACADLLWHGFLRRDREGWEN